MATSLVPGQRDWSMSRDEDGHRTYKIKYLVVGSSLDGPLSALATAGIPVVGNTWVIDNDNDPWAWCRPEVSVTPILKNEPNRYFELEFTFSTKPITHCQTEDVANPLSIANKVSGSFTKYTEEATFDRFGEPIENSAHEMLRGPQVEFDHNRLTIKIQQNVANLQLGLLCQMVDTVNHAPLWGISRGCIKMGPPTWERKFYGNCNVYYDRTLEFEIRFEGFTRDVLDEGTKVLHGHWDKASGNWITDPVGTLSWPNNVQLSANNFGGTLVHDIYAYRVTALNAVGESLPSPEVTINIAAGVTTGTIQVTWDAVSGATGYNLYGRTIGAELKLSSFASSGIIDTGTVTPAGALPTTSTAGVPPDPTNPQHFDKFTDRKMQPCKVVLNQGLPAGVALGPATGTGTLMVEPGKIHIEYYKESDFTLLGIPLSF